MEAIKQNEIIIQAGCKLIIKELESIPLDLKVQRLLKIAETDHQEVKLEVIKQMLRLWQDKKVLQV